MASDSVLLAMCLCFCFCVPCALMSIVLTPPLLFPDYWLICPSCVSSLPSFSPFIISLCLQSCVSSSSSSVVCVPLVLPCPALPVCFFPIRGSFCCLFLFLFVNKALLPPAIESSLSSLPPTLTQINAVLVMQKRLLSKTLKHHTNPKVLSSNVNVVCFDLMLTSSKC